MSWLLARREAESGSGREAGVKRAFNGGWLWEHGSAALGGVAAQQTPPVKLAWVALYSSEGGFSLFSIIMLSPVKLDSSTNRSVDARSRQSAGTRSPVSSTTMSPGTSSRASMSSSWPLRSAVQRGGISLVSSARDCSERYSCTNATVDTITTLEREGESARGAWRRRHGAARAGSRAVVVVVAAPREQWRWRRRIGRAPPK